MYDRISNLNIHMYVNTYAYVCAYVHIYSRQLAKTVDKLSWHFSS